MNAEGFIKLHRQITENEFWNSERFTKAQAWIDLLLMATFKHRTVFIRGIEINLHPGDLCYSQLTLAERWKWNERTVNKYLNMLKIREMIQTKITNVTTIISIQKWSEYQLNTEQLTDQNTGQLTTRMHTNKNVKNDKNEKKNIYAIENFPIGLNGETFLKTKYFYVTKSLIKEFQEKLQINLSEADLESEFYKMEAWLEVNKPKKNYKMFFINWLKRAVNNPKIEAAGQNIPAAHKYL